MSLPLIFRLEARLEFEEAVAWYEKQQAGMGQEFALEVTMMLERAQANAKLFKPIRGRAHKIHLRRFTKYTIYYAIKDDVFAVMSVFHGSRNPEQLRRRLK